MLGWRCWPTWGSGARRQSPARGPYRTWQITSQTPSTITVRTPLKCCFCLIMGLTQQWLVMIRSYFTSAVRVPRNTMLALESPRENNKKIFASCSSGDGRGSEGGGVAVGNRGSAGCGGGRAQPLRQGHRNAPGGRARRVIAESSCALTSCRSTLVTNNASAYLLGAMEVARSRFDKDTGTPEEAVPSEYLLSHRAE